MFITRRNSKEEEFNELLIPVNITRVLFFVLFFKIIFKESERQRRLIGTKEIS